MIHVSRGTLKKYVKLKKAGERITDLFANLFIQAKLI